MRILLIGMAILQIAILVLLAKTEVQQASSMILFNMWIIAALTYKE